QIISELRRRHRVSASLVGNAPAIPEELVGSVRISSSRQGELVMEADELSSLFRWLATLPVTEIRAEPIGLRAIYDRFHAHKDAPA
ncbi:MAG: ABC transporter ATP-binding protein, partial [Pirellulaceae bacterium]